jgi:hypothetical protein
MDILLESAGALRLNQILQLCREWNEAHPEEPAEPEWVEEMVAARARWSEMVTQHHPRQRAGYDDYDAWRARLPRRLVVQLLEALCTVPLA